MKVLPPPPTVPGFIVTYSLIVLSSPIIKFVSSLLYFKSCGWLPIDENGYIVFPFPIIVLPEIFTWEWIIVLLLISTLGPITQ